MRRPVKFFNVEKPYKPGQYSRARRSAKWTPERRAAQAAAIRRYKPWLRATGPKTREGKRRACMNALKSGVNARQMRRLRHLLHLQRKFAARLDRAHREMFRARREEYWRTFEWGRSEFISPHKFI